MNYLEFFKSLIVALWYNGVDQQVLEWLDLKPNEYGTIECPITCHDAGTWKALVWSLLVCYCGEYGTSPRYGWIPKEGVEEFYDVLNRIKRYNVKTVESYEFDEEYGMANPIEITDVVLNKTEISETKQVNIGDVIETNCGLDHIALSPDDIKHMVEGGKIWVEINCGEYAAVIELKGAHHV